jgi:hypothetical protein
VSNPDRGSARNDGASQDQVMAVDAIEAFFDLADVIIMVRRLSREA